ncbi:hypothetical protein [Streptomyces litchfieldiae]|uniref:Uncharacterized protein n=1 Tax=Streptomyces litchfieldiae TaxID=3075543 RepID=A0ABU2N1E1_9ACTN|nr:hypothetical protein [Streptomyces sp. DSM 44938]MDT0347732.1 hypothetical protein [Streptomyces sp. DSM 44938]
MLEFVNVRNSGGRAGILIRNSGLGPAFVARSKVWIDGIHAGHLGREAVDRIRAETRANMGSLETNYGGTWVLPPGDSRFLLSVEDSVDAREAFWSFILNRFAMEFTYDSIYGGEGYRLRYREITPD